MSSALRVGDTSEASAARFRDARVRSRWSVLMRRKYERDRRERLRVAGRCIDDTVIPTHGEVVKGGRCAICYVGKT